MIYAAFYKGTGTMRDRVVRMATASLFSHVELVLGPIELGQAAWAVSASARDGGVRAKTITFHPDRWVLVPLPMAPAQCLDRAERQSGAKYDVIGAVLTQLPFVRYPPIRTAKPAPSCRAGRWFCSALIADALGLTSPHRFTPASLFDHLRDLNTAFDQGSASASRPPLHSGA